MPFPSEIQAALQTYDANKGFWRRLFRRDQAAIRALHRLSETDQTNHLIVYRCFIENKPKDNQESYKVYQAFLDYLVQEECSSIPETLDQLHNNKLLNLSNLNKLKGLDGNKFSQLALLFRLLNSRGLLTQGNFDQITDYLKKNINELTSFINLVNILGHRFLNQANLNWLLEKPLPDESIVRILKLLAENNMLISENRDQLLLEKNKFLLSNNAYLVVWDPLEVYLPTLSKQKKQLIFDKLISLTQEEDSIKKIENYISELIPKASKRPRRNTYDKFSTAPPLRSKSRDSLNGLVSLVPTRMSTL